MPTKEDREEGFTRLSEFKGYLSNGETIPDSEIRAYGLFLEGCGFSNEGRFSNTIRAISEQNALPANERSMLLLKESARTGYFGFLGREMIRIYSSDICLSFSKKYGKILNISWTFDRFGKLARVEAYDHTNGTGSALAKVSIDQENKGCLTGKAELLDLPPCLDGLLVTNGKKLIELPENKQHQELLRMGHNESAKFLYHSNQREFDSKFELRRGFKELKEVLNDDFALCMLERAAALHLSLDVTGQDKGQIRYGKGFLRK